MKVMFLCGYLHEGVGIAFGKSEESMGGWVKGFVNMLSSFDDIELYYAAFEKGEKQSVVTKRINDITYSVITYSDEQIINKFLTSFPCDLYHLFGIESEHAKVLLPFLDFNKTLVYIQGIIEASIPYYNADYDKYHYVSPVFRLYMRINKYLFSKRAVEEKAILDCSKYVAGRTDWDAAFISNLNHPVTYYHLNESLRDGFYTAEKWSLLKMHRHTIFVTQASYPLKGAHMIMEIVRLLKEKYPDVTCRIGGENLMHAASTATKLGISYASYIKKLIGEYQLDNNIIFTGNLNEQQIIHEMQNANVFLLASSVENSPNSLQEAMLLGTPSVSSFVGGVSSLVSNCDQCQLYPFNDPLQAAYKISCIFDNDLLAEKLSKNGIERISRLTDRKVNGQALHDIYTSILKHNNQADCGGNW